MSAAKSCVVCYVKCSQNQTLHILSLLASKISSLKIRSTNATSSALPLRIICVPLAIICIIGHSERRTYFHETNETVNKKVKAALKHGLTPIMCVGERLEERDSGKTFDVVRNHVEGGLAGLSKEDVSKIVIAYEPVWAIGTGRTATPEQAQEVHKYIRELLKRAYGEDVSSKVRIQYGGSVKPDNTKSIMAGPDIDGALVGGASLKVKDFAEIVRQGKK